MHDLRRHGTPPFRNVLINGGPGAKGELSAVAAGVPAGFGLLEPLFSEPSIHGHIRELEEAASLCERPITLVGWSFGAWLSILFADVHPSWVSRLVLVGSGPLDERYAPQVTETRYRRLDAVQRLRLDRLFEMAAAGEGGDEVIEELSDLISLADDHDIDVDLVPDRTFDTEIFRNVSPEASALRHSGKLLEAAGRLECEVVVIHGDRDPHPHQGVVEPLLERSRKAEVHLLLHCGHRPWLERKCRSEFFDILIDDLER